MLRMWTRTITCIAVVVFAWQGCPGPGAKSGFRVKGEIALDSGRPPEGCEVKLYRQDQTDFVTESDIPPKFEKFFFIDPVKRKYYMTFACEGVEKPHQTQVYDLGNKVKELDLGTIMLEDSAKRPEAP